jgi:PKD domain
MVAALLGAATPAVARPTRPAPWARPALTARTISAKGTASASTSTNLYVDNASTANCSDSGSGTETQPFCTIAAAAAAVQPGQTVVVEPGDYAGATISVSGTASSPITFSAADDSAGTIQVDGGIVVSGAQDVLLSGFNVTAPQPFLVDNSSGITIDGGSATGQGQGSLPPAVQVTGTSSDVMISRMSIASLTTAVEIDPGVTGAVVTTNTIMHNSGASASPGPGVLVTDAPGTDVVSNTLVTDCQTGVIVTGASPGSVLENNIAETATLPANDPTACSDPADAIGFSVSAASTPQTVADYNLIDPTSGGPLYSWAGTTYTSLGAFTAATGQGTHDIAADPELGSEVGALDYRFYFSPSVDSPAINSANADAPGELASDQLDNAWADDPTVPNTGTGPGYYDRGAVALEGGLSFGPLTDEPDPAGGPLAITPSDPITSSWTTDGSIGTYEYLFGDGTLPVVTSATTVGHTFSTAGEYPVTVIASADGFPSGYSTTTHSTVVVGADYTPVTPTRILDTRNGIGAPKAAVAAGGDLTLTIPPVGGVSASALSAIALNVTVTGPTAGGSLTVFTQSGAGASTSNIDFAAGQTIANLVTIKPVNGTITIQNNSKGTVQVIGDLDGYYSNSGSGFEDSSPVRVLDTRNKIGTTAAGPVPARGTVRLNLSGELPAGAAAAVLNLTVTQPKEAGEITAYANGQPLPGTSNLNFTAGETIPNQVIVPLTDDVADFYNGSAGTVQLIADLDGYYASGATGSFVPYGPTRIADTRTGLGVTAGAIPARGTLVITPDAFNTGCNPLATCWTLPEADVLNVTVTQPKAGGVLVVHNDNGGVPDTSNLNFTAGQTIANLVTVPSDGKVAIYNQSSGSVQIVVDQEGYYIAPV